MGAAGFDQRPLACEAFDRRGMQPARKAETSFCRECA